MQTNLIHGRGLPGVKLSSLAWALFALCLALARQPVAAAAARPPNIVLILADDMGWGDLGCYGSKTIRTPHLDRLASEGTRFTSFYVSQPVCSASRLSLLTGCYANRLGIHGALGPGSKVGLSAGESTLADLLRLRGYATAIYGKWHLGEAPEFLPTAHGFGDYFGLPYSNDMWPNHPTAKPGVYPPLPLYQGTNVVERMPDQRFLTRRYTDHAVRFIEANAAKPFFLYVPHNMPHVPLHVSDAHAGRSPHGLYADVIEELDASVGEILAALDRFHLKENTWVIFLSDNGPWHNYGNHAGSAGPFREGKGSVFEGGIRVPCIMRWPGEMPRRRVVDAPLMTIDVLPTIARRVGAPLPQSPIDGRDVWPVLVGQRGATNPHEAYAFYYNQGELQAVRSGPWKLLLPHRANGLNGKPPGADGKPGPYDRIQVGTELYHLERDPRETTDVAAREPKVMERMQRLVEGFREDLGDSLTKREGRGLRPPGRIVAPSAP